MLSRLSIKQKLILIMTIPLIIVVFLSSKLVIDFYNASKNLKTLDNVVSLSTRIGALVHETQRERGMTAGFIGSNGTEFKNRLKKQRKEVDEKVNDLNIFLKTFNENIYERDFLQYLNSGIEMINNLPEIRKKTDALTITGSEAIDYYTQTNSILLNTFEAIIDLSNNSSVSKKLVSYMNFLLAKERTGIERAIGTNTFAVDDFSKSGTRPKFYALVTEQNTYLDSFIKVSTIEVENFYEKTVQGPVIEEVERMRKVALFSNINSHFGINPNYWYDQITQKIDLLGKVENYIRKDLVLTINEELKKANINMTIFIFLSVLGIVIAMVLARAISDVLDFINHTILKII